MLSVKPPPPDVVTPDALPNLRRIFAEYLPKSGPTEKWASEIAIDVQLWNGAGARVGSVPCLLYYLRSYGERLFSHATDLAELKRALEPISDLNDLPPRDAPYITALAAEIATEYGDEVVRPKFVVAAVLTHPRAPSAARDHLEKHGIDIAGIVERLLGPRPREVEGLSSLVTPEAIAVLGPEIGLLLRAHDRALAEARRADSEAGAARAAARRSDDTVKELRKDLEKAGKRK